MSKAKSIMLILLSGVAAIFIAMAWVNYGAASLGALVYSFTLIGITLFTIIAFSLFDRCVENRYRLTMIIVFINLLAGVFMRLDFYYFNAVNW